MGKFDNHGEVSLVPGDIVGLRAFKVQKDGTLISPAQEWPWQDGENVAECTVHPYAPEYWHNTGGHHIAHPDCSCGFYAYFYERPNEYHSPGWEGTVEAIVRGTGKATVGSYGFRVEKAEIVGLVEPHPKDFKDDDPKHGGWHHTPATPMPWWAKAARWAYNHEDGLFGLTIAAVVLTTIASIALSVFVAAGWAWLAAAILPELVLGIGPLFWAEGKPWTKYEDRYWYEAMNHESELTSESWELVKKKYPSAKVYKLTTQAKAAIPMTFHPSNMLPIPEFYEEVN